MKVNKYTTLLAAAFLAASVAVPAAAATVITPTNATATTSLRAASPISATIDGTGLVSTSGDISTWTHAVNDPQGNYWLSGSNAGKNGTEVITFDLGGTYDVDGLYLWQYTLSNSTNRQIVDATLTFSTDGINYSNSISWKPQQVTTTVAYTPENFTFTTVQDVTHVKMLVKNNSDFVGLAEIRFSAVPEPSAFGLLAGCFALTWVMLRRR